MYYNVCTSARTWACPVDPCASKLLQEIRGVNDLRSPEGAAPLVTETNRHVTVLGTGKTGRHPGHGSLQPARAAQGMESMRPAWCMQR